MKMAVSFLLLLSVFAINYGQTPPEQPAQVQAVFKSFHSSLNDLTKRFGKKSPRGIKAEIAQSLDSITENVEFLAKVLTPEKPGPKEYLEGVALDAEFLKKLAAQNFTTAPQLKTLNLGLKELASDLTLKITGPRAGGDIARVVEVFVHAKKGGQDIGEYQVWYVRKSWEKDKPHYKPFDSLTDPSHPPSMKIAPGIYLIWLTKGKFETLRQLAFIGENRETQRVIQVPVP